VKHPVCAVVGSGRLRSHPKRFPHDDEAKFLAGVDALYPVGRTLMLICHDAQAFNRRNRCSVAKAKQTTVRSRAIKELDSAPAGLGYKCLTCEKDGRIGSIGGYDFQRRSCSGHSSAPKTF
jgi:hypothetical protein